MLYLKSFSIPSVDDEVQFLSTQRLGYTSYASKYPFTVFRNEIVQKFEFEPITVFCGGNGCGKSTLMNVIANKIKIERGAVYNRTDFFDEYVKLCRYRRAMGCSIPEGSRIITSDDVFDYLLDIRCINNGVDRQRAKILNKYISVSDYKLTSLDDYEEWKRYDDGHRVATNKMSKDKFLTRNLMRNVQEKSNGESALMYFTGSIKENALYLLDEPENSLSAALQLELKRFIEDSARFYNCQFIISTHSPFLLSMDGAKIYNLDIAPPKVCKWTEIPSVKLYHDFFEENRNKFN